MFGPMHVHFSTVASTMDEAARRVRAGDTTTFAVSADEQTAGRGRLGRVWQTFPHHSLAVTYIFRPAQGPHLPLVAALALHRALSSPACAALGRAGVLEIKWPNDLLLNGRKVAGILCENIGARASLVGIGLNLVPPEEGIPPEFAGTFLFESRHELAGLMSALKTAQAGAQNVPDAAWAPLVTEIGTCLSQLIDLYGVNGWGVFYEDYLSHCASIGKKVRWKNAQHQELTGIARGLNEGGQLEMAAEDGTVHVIHSGDIIEYK